MFRNRVFLLAAFIALLVGFAGQSPAQTFYGSVVGIVTDASGAPVASVPVALTNTGTAERRTAQTDANGNYQFLELLPGIYKVDVEQPGFKHLTRDQIQVRVDNPIRVNVALEVGDVTQSVEVSSQAALLQTESASLNQVVEGRQVQDMPLNGRNVFNLVALVPGVVPMGATQGFPLNNTGTSTNPSGFGNYQIGGGIVAENAIFVDGAQDDLSGNNTPLVPTQDSIQEFSVITNNVSPEYGGFGGGVINMTTKSGTNAFHGSAYEYLRNSKLNANDFFANRTGIPRAPFTQNQFGSTVGGPVRRNKTFFFAAWEGFSLRKGIATIYTVPTAAFRAGNFAGQPIIYDPLSSCGPSTTPACSAVTRTPFPNNQIPANRFDPTTLVMQKYWPLPNLPGNANNYTLNVPTGGNSNQGSIRADHSINDKQRLFARYTSWTLSNSPSDPFHNLTGAVNYSVNTNQVVLGYIYTITPTLILDLRGAYLRETFPSFALSYGTDMSQFGPAWAALGPQMTWTDYPGETISGGFKTQSGGGQISRDNDYFYTGSITKIMGRHTIKAGGNFKRDLALNHNGTSSGTFNFDATFTSAAATNSATSGLGFADFVLGYPTSGSISTYNAVYTFLNTYGFYVTDTWQIHPRLTLNLGLRWDQPGADGELKNNDMVLSLTAPDPLGAKAGLPNLVGQPELVASPAYPSRLEQQLRWNDFGPRVGLAWRANDKTVIRSGFGINFLPYLVSKYPDTIAAVNSSVTTMVTTLNGGLTPANSMSNPFPNGLIQPAGRTPGFLQTLEGGNIFGVLPTNQPSKYAMQWNFTIQRDLGHNASLQATYASTEGRHLYWGGAGINLDQLPDQYLSMGSALLTQVHNPFYGVLPTSVGVLGQPTVAQGYLLRPYPQFLAVQTLEENTGISSYNALQLTFQKRFNGGGTLVANYTWSKFMSNTEAQTGSGESDITFGGTQDWTNRTADYSLSSGNVPQRAVISYVYDLPFGKGKRFLPGLSGVANQVIGGWSLNGVTTFANGLPLNITALANTLSSQFGAGTIRPNVVAGCNTELSGSSQSRISEWFNTACFQQPGSFAFGDSSRTSPNLRQAGIANFDFAINKTFVVREGWNLEFHTEFFNLFNREQFAAPNVQEGNPSFGIVTATSPTANPRLVQFALRFKF